MLPPWRGWHSTQPRRGAIKFWTAVPRPQAVLPSQLPIGADRTRSVTLPLSTCHRRRRSHACRPPRTLRQRSPPRVAAAGETLDRLPARHSVVDEKNPAAATAAPRTCGSWSSCPPSRVSHNATADQRPKTRAVGERQSPPSHRPRSPPASRLVELTAAPGSREDRCKDLRVRTRSPQPVDPATDVPPYPNASHPHRSTRLRHTRATKAVPVSNSSSTRRSTMALFSLISAEWDDHDSALPGDVPSGRTLPPSLPGRTRHAPWSSLGHSAQTTGRDSRLRCAYEPRRSATARAHCCTFSSGVDAVYRSADRSVPTTLPGTALNTH